MIEKLRLKNFKVHSNSEFKLSKLNILTGMNGMGKSSVIQSLLLLRQTHTRSLLNKGLELNGELSSIGVAEDAMYKYAEDSDDIEFEIDVNGHEHKWSFKADAAAATKTFINANYSSDITADMFSLFTNDFQYISAFRNGPIGIYEKDTSSVELLNQISRREGRAELVAHYFDFFKDYIVADNLIKNDKIELTVKNQVQEWMREISPDINIDVTAKDSSYAINYTFNRGAGLTVTDSMRDTNIGFGISYVLPIVVAILVANARVNDSNSVFSAEEKLIIIENPEAHIHPRAQANLMELICLAASNGTQFIIETHSDHIINGLLVSIKKNMLAIEDAKVYFIARDEKLHSAKPIMLDIREGGKIKNPPPGFFDQIDIHMKTLMGF